MQNKPNFQKAKVKLTSCSTKDYENDPTPSNAEKQTQSNPISKGTLAQSYGLPTEGRGHFNLQFAIYNLRFTVTIEAGVM